MRGSVLGLAAKVLGVLVILTGLFYGALVAQRNAILAGNADRVREAVELGVLPPGPAWKPVLRPELNRWLARLAVPLQKLESQDRIAGRGGTTRSPYRSATASAKEILRQVRDLLDEAPEPPWVLGPKDTQAGWLDWAPAIGQLLGVGLAVEQEVERLLDEDRGAAALELLTDMLRLLQGLEGHTYALNETIARTESEVLAVAMTLLAPAAEGSADREAWLAAVSEALEPWIERGTQWPPYQARLLRSFDRGVNAERTDEIRARRSKGASNCAAVCVELLTLWQDGDHEGARTRVNSISYQDEYLVKDLYGIYAGCLATQREYAFLGAVLQLSARAAQQGAWPARGEVGIRPDPLTKKPFAYTLSTSEVQVEGQQWLTQLLVFGHKRRRLQWSSPR